MVQAKERADREARRATESARISDFFMVISDIKRGTSILVKSYLPANVPHLWQMVLGQKKGNFGGINEGYWQR